MVNKCIFILLLGTAILPLQGYAGDNFYLGALLGQAVLTDEAGKNADDGIAFGMYGGYHINPDIALETSLTYSAHDDVVSEPGDYDIRLLSLLFGPRFSYSVMKDVNVHSGAGFGIYIVDYRFKPEGLPELSRHEDDGEAGIYAGAGVDFPVSKQVSLGLDVKYHYIFKNELLDGDMLTMLITIGFF